MSKYIWITKDNDGGDATLMLWAFKPEFDKESGQWLCPDDKELDGEYQEMCLEMCDFFGIEFDGQCLKYELKAAQQKG